MVAAAAMGIPISVYLSPVLLGIVILLTDLINLVVPMPDLGGNVLTLYRSIPTGGPGVLQATLWILVVWILPGIVAIAALYALIRWRLDHVGSDRIVHAIKARHPKPSNAEERELLDIVQEFALAASIAAPKVVFVDRGTNAFIFGRSPDQATIVVGRRMLSDLDREATQGAIARLIASATDGDLGLATDVGAVYVTYGLLTTGLATIVSPNARTRLRSGIGALRGKPPDGPDDHGLEAFVGLPVDEDFDSESGRGYLSLLTMGGFVGAAVKMVNLVFAGPLLVVAWRSRVSLGDALAVDLTRNPTALARALRTLGDGPGIPGSGWLELLLVTAGNGTSRWDTRYGRSLSDSGVIASLAPSIATRVARLERMGANTTAGAQPAPGQNVAGGSIGRFRVTAERPKWKVNLIVASVVLLGGAFAVLLTVLLIFLIGVISGMISMLVTYPLHQILRGIAGH
jgi:Zn-dependent protease with chaperone function